MRKRIFKADEQRSRATPDSFIRGSTLNGCGGAFLCLALLVAGCSSTKVKGPEFLEQPSRPSAKTEAGVERSIIREIDFVGNNAYKDSVLQKKLGFNRGDYLDPILAEAYRGTLSEFYRNNGFVSAEVVLDSEKLKNGRVVYTIDEGPRARITKVSFLNSLLYLPLYAYGLGFCRFCR